MYSTLTRHEYAKRCFISLAEQTFFHKLIRTSRTALYVTFTFTYKVGSECAFKKLRAFIDDVSHLYGDNIAWIAALESTLSGCTTSAIRPHFHCILFSDSPISPETINHLWTKAFGRVHCKHYDLSQNGIGYIMKMRQYDTCEWDISDNAYIFHPFHQPRNSRQRRVIARQLRRNRQHSLSGCGMR